MCVFDAIYNTQKGNLIKECNVEKWNVEYVMFNGLLTDMGRVIGFALLLIVGYINNMVIFKLLLLFIVLFVPVYSKLVFDVENKE